MATPTSQPPLPGGFTPPTPQNPNLPLSPASTTTSLDTSNGVLPTPRQRPLPSGSSKETAFIQYVDKGILEVTRRYAKKFSEGFGSTNEEGGKDGGAQSRSQARVDKAGVRGYEDFKEVCADVSKLVDVVWVSGTSSLQIPYLLALALLIVTYLPSFPPSPRPTFKLLRKFDTAFDALLDAPGRSGFSITDMVRLRSSVGRTRSAVVDVMEGGGAVEEEESREGMEGVEMEGEGEGEDGEGDGKWEMEVARVYELTIVKLGEALGDGWL